MTTSKLTLGLCVWLWAICLFASASSAFVHRHATTRSLAPACPLPSCPWFNTSLTTAARVAAFIAQLNITEKAGQLLDTPRAIERLGILDFSYSNEGSHGVARAGRATVFPSPIALASTFDAPLLLQLGQILAVEARAKYNVYRATHGGRIVPWYGLNFFAPNINLFIHALWGRGMETFGEDPFLSGELSVQYVLGMQDIDLKPGNKYVKAAACCKHSFVYGISDPNTLSNLTVSNTDLEQTFLPAFKDCITRGKARSTMSSYASFNGYQSTANPLLPAKLKEWNHTGFACSDDGSVSLIVANSTTLKVAMALNNGIDLNLGGEYEKSIPLALSQGYITMQRIDQALTRILTERIKSADWDGDLDPWRTLDLTSVDSAAHRSVAGVAAREGIILLKNEGLLPLNLSMQSSTPIRRIAVVGPNADRPNAQLGNYCGCQDGSPQGDPPLSKGCQMVTPYAAISTRINAENAHRSATDAIALTNEKGADVNSTDRSGFQAAIQSVEAADVAVLVFGIGTCLGPWGGPPDDCIEAEAMDRKQLGVTGVQAELLRLLIATGTPIVLVTMSGSPLDLREWVMSPSVVSIVQTFYGGAEAGTGLADLILHSDTIPAISPSGKLPVTFPLDASQIIPDGMMDMAKGGISYRYSQRIPLYSFGYGGSYTTFSYAPVSNLPILSPATISAPTNISLRFQVQNTGNFDGDEIVQVYVSVIPSTAPTAIQSIPRTELKYFTRISLKRGTAKTNIIELDTTKFQLIDATGKLSLLPGIYYIHIGGSSPSSRGFFVDGADHHPRVLQVPRPSLQACPLSAALQWSHMAIGSPQDSVLSLPIEQSIAGGLVAVLTVC